MKDKVASYIRQLHMVQPGDRVLVGLSGGADSVCLLLLLHDLSQELDIYIEAIHVEHGIRGAESLDDAAFSRHLCEQMGIMIHICHVNAVQKAHQDHSSLEESARILRYECYETYCRERDMNVIALAHHADDNAETMLFHLCRGAGLRGLGGIAPVRMDQNGNRIIRPLLCCDRKDIEAWLQLKQQSFCTDQTNMDITYSRNKLRHQVLPVLGAVNEQAVQHMSKTAALLRDVADFVEQMAEQEGQNCVVSETPVTLECGRLQEMHPVIRNAFLMQQLESVAGQRKDLTNRHVDAIVNILGKHGHRVSLPYGLEAFVSYGRLVISPQKMDEWKEAFSGTLPLAGSVTLPAYLYRGNLAADMKEKGTLQLETRMLKYSGDLREIPQNNCTKWFDYDKIKNTVQIRTRRAGDYLQSDRAGNRKQVKRYLIDEKIPSDRRNDVFMLADGEHIIWVLGGRISEWYKVSDETEHVLEVRITGVPS